MTRVVLVELDRAEREGAYTRWYVLTLGPVDRILIKPVRTSRRGGEARWIDTYDIPLGVRLARVRRSGGECTVTIYEVVEDGLKPVKTLRVEEPLSLPGVVE